MAAAFATRRRGGTACLRSRPDRAARHGLALDAGRRHALLQDRSRLLIDARVRAEPALIRLDPFYPILPDTDWLARLLPLGHQAGAAPHQRRAARRRARRDRKGGRALRRASLPARGQRLLAGGDRRGRATSCISARRIWRAPIFAAIRAAGIKIGVSTHSHAELEAALAAERRLCRARSDLRDHAEGDALGAARPSPPCRMARANRLPAGRDRRHHARPRAASVLAAGADSAAVITDIVTSRRS